MHAQLPRRHRPEESRASGAPAAVRDGMLDVHHRHGRASHTQRRWLRATGFAVVSDVPQHHTLDILRPRGYHRGAVSLRPHRRPGQDGRRLVAPNSTRGASCPPPTVRRSNTLCFVGVARDDITTWPGCSWFDASEKHAWSLGTCENGVAATDPLPTGPLAVGGASATLLHTESPRNVAAASPSVYGPSWLQNNLIECTGCRSGSEKLLTIAWSPANDFLMSYLTTVPS